MDVKTAASENIPEYVRWIYPEIMTTDDLQAKISQFGIPVENTTHLYLCEIYYKHLSPLPRRTPHPNRRGKRMLEKIRKEETLKKVEIRHLGAFNETKRKFSPQTSSTPELDRLAARSKAVMMKQKGSDISGSSEMDKLAARSKTAIMTQQKNIRLGVSGMEKLETRNKKSATKQKNDNTIIKIHKNDKSGILSVATLHDSVKMFKPNSKKIKLTLQRELAVNKRLNGDSDTNDYATSPAIKAHLKSDVCGIKCVTVFPKNGEMCEKCASSDDTSDGGATPIKKAKLVSGTPKQNANEPKKPGGKKRIKLDRKSLTSFSDG